AAADGVAMDLALCELLGIAPKAVPFLPPAIRCPSPVNVDTQDVGLGGHRVPQRALDLPSTFVARMIPSWLVRLLEPFVWIRPAIRETCIQCGKCVEACPVEALSIEQGSNPQLKAKACIGCCCCHEICPAKAIEMTQSPLLNRIRRGRMP
ncbi:MAG: 4Fe-4S binding protein, partial [Verrucomicrobia bacterium]|nr:4Fe-4S binding protein [Verrucomicrobiota bacterium]